MPQYLYFILIIVMEVLIAWRFYREEKYFAPVIALFVNLFSLSAILIMDNIFNLHLVILGLLLLLMNGTGYFIFFKGGFKKALAVSISANTVGLGIAMILFKIFG